MPFNAISAMPEFRGMLFLAGSWSPMLLVVFRYETIALLLSIIVAILAIVDYCLKIHWKIRQAHEKKHRLYSLTEEEAAWVEQRRHERGY